MKKNITYIVLLFGTFAFAQIEQGEVTVTRQDDIKQESVTVERIYEPKVEAAEKIKQTPIIEDSDNEKLNVEYGLKDVEAESDFETSTIGAEELPVKDASPYNNYIRLGYGNRATLILDGFGEYELDESKSVGGSLSYLSTNGEIPDIAYDTGNAKMDAEGFFKMNFDQAQADIRLGGSMHKLNYYGIGLDPESDQNRAIDDIDQRYTKLYTSAKYDAYNHAFLDEVSMNAGFFGDKHDAKESNFDIRALFSRMDLTSLDILGTLDVGASADVNLNFANTNFEEIFEAKFTQFTAGIAPQLHFDNDILKLKAGVNLQYDAESESGENDFHVFPKAEVFVTTVPAFGLYGGITGGVKQNRYQSLYDKNPFLLPNQNLKSTINKMEVYVGVRGDIGANLKYDASAKYQDLENILFFSKYNLFTQGITQFNSFNAIYDDGTRTAIEANINYLGITNLTLGGNLLMQTYSLDNFEEAWNEPILQASISADYKLLEDKLILGGDLFYIDNRKATYASQSVVTTTAPSINLKPIIDLNLNATYLILDRWAAFIEIQNALNKNYDRFLGYPVQGVTAAGGVMFKF